MALALVVPTLIAKLFGAGWGTAAAFGQMAFVARRYVGDLHRRAALAPARPGVGVGSRPMAGWALSSRRAIARRGARAGPARGRARLRLRLRDAHRRARLAHAADGLRRRDRADQGSARACCRSTRARRSRPPSRRPRSTSTRAAGWCWASASRTGHGRELVPEPSSKPLQAMREYVGIAARLLPRRGPAAGRDLQQPASASWATQPRADLPIYVAALSPKMLRAGRRDRRRRDAVALQPRLHPGRRGARGAGGPRAGRQDARGLRHRGRRPGRRDRRPRRGLRRRCAPT